MQENQNRTNMVCVYASPERMSASHNEEGDTYEERTYPFFYAADDDLDHTLIMKEVYGGPTFLSKSVSSSDVSPTGRASGMNDTDVTVQICRKCGKTFAATLIACPFCGKGAREQQSIDSNISLVHAYPEIMGPTKKSKTGLLDKLLALLKKRRNETR